MTADTPALLQFGFIRQKQLTPAIIPFSSATLWRRIADGTFPKPVKLSPRITAWDIREVRDWIEARKADTEG